MKLLRPLALLAAVTCVVSAHAQLGVAGNFNEYVLGNDTRTNSDVEGLTAIGGNLNVTSFTLNGNQVGSYDGYSSIVGGSVTANGGTLYGNLYAGTTVHSNNFTVDGTVTSGGSVTSPINFATTNAYLINYSNYLGSLGANGSTAIQYSSLNLTGTNSTLDVFDVTTAQLASGISQISISAPSTATILINVTGSSAAIPNGGFQFSGGAVQDHVLYNFVGATSLTFGSVSGSILAPEAAATTAYGAVDGNLIVGSLSGSTQTNSFLFDGGGLPPTPSPEPFTLAMPVVLGAAWLRRRAKARRA